MRLRIQRGCKGLASCVVMTIPFKGQSLKSILEILLEIDERSLKFPLQASAFAEVDKFLTVFRQTIERRGIFVARRYATKSAFIAPQAIASHKTVLQASPRHALQIDVS